MQDVLEALREIRKIPGGTHLTCLPDDASAPRTPVKQAAPTNPPTRKKKKKAGIGAGGIAILVVGLLVLIAILVFVLGNLSG